MILSQRIAQLNMSNKRNRIGLKSSLFSSLCSEPEDSPSDLLPSYQGTVQQLILDTSKKSLSIHQGWSQDNEYKLTVKVD